MSVYFSNRSAMKNLMLWALTLTISTLLVLFVNANAKGETEIESKVQEKSAVKQERNQVDNIAYARLGEQIRQNKIAVGDLYSVSDVNGRFHNIHADKLLMDCSHCHGLLIYKKDYLLVSKYKKLSENNKGRVEKAVCLGCHLPGGMGTPWYGSSTIKE